MVHSCSQGVFGRKAFFLFCCWQESRRQQDDTWKNSGREKVVVHMQIMLFHLWFFLWSFPAAAWRLPQCRSGKHTAVKGTSRWPSSSWCTPGTQHREWRRFLLNKNLTSAIEQPCDLHCLCAFKMRKHLRLSSDDDMKGFQRHLHSRDVSKQSSCNSWQSVSVAVSTHGLGKAWLGLQPGSGTH